MASAAHTSASSILKAVPIFSSLSEQIGTVRELVSRNLSRLRAEGLIQMEGRTVVIPDLTKLEGELEGSQ